MAPGRHPKLIEEGRVKRPKALGAYIFAGAFSVGVRRHFDILGHLEGSDYGVETAKLNFPGMPIRYPEAKWGDDEFGSPDFIYANPPCAIFSPMGIVTTQGADSWKTDPRVECWRNAMSLFERRRPGAFALESVPQAYTRGRSMVDEFTRRALKLGYSATHLLLDAKWTGIPQSRKRFFLVFHRQPRLLGYQFNYAPPPTVGDVLAEINDPGYFTKFGRSGWTELIRDTVPGERLCTTWMRQNPGWNDRRNSKGQVTGRPSFQDRRLNADEVMGAWVGDKFYHPTEARFIGLEEGKAICGYPSDFKIAQKDLRGWGSLLARAVMPPVGEWLARAVATTLTAKSVNGIAEQRVHFVDVRTQGIDPVDITAEYIAPNGKLIEVAEHRELAAEIEDEELAEATTASTVQEPREPGPAARRQSVRGDGNVPGKIRAHEPAAGPALTDGGEETDEPRNDRPGSHTAGRQTGSAREAPAESARGATPSDVIRTIVEVTGVEESLAARVARALAFTPDLATVAEVTGVDPSVVRRVYAARRLVIESPAGRPSAAPAAQVPEERTAPVLDDPSRDAVKPVHGETSRERAVKPTPGSSYVPNDGDPKPKEDEGSGAFIRRMIMNDAHSPDQIVGLVLANFEGRKTTVKDVGWNWNKLRVDGHEPPPWRGAKVPSGYPGMKADVSQTASKPTRKPKAADRLPAPVPAAANAPPAAAGSTKRYGGRAVDAYFENER